METLQRTANRGSISTGFDIDNSLKLEADNTEYLSRTPSSNTNRQTWTFSAWVKRAELGQTARFIDVYSDGVNQTTFGFDTSDRILIYTIDSAVDYGGTYTQRFRDTSAWYHVVWKSDTTNATVANRFQLYVNGVEVTDKEIDYGDPPLNFNTLMNTTTSTKIGYSVDQSTGSSQYMAEIHLIDGQALEPTEFGEFDEDSGIWKPKVYEGTYGTNGFYLDFESSGSLGADSSGNSNNFTLNNITSANQAVDTPTNSFTTWNTIRYFNAGVISFKEGGTVLSNSFNGGFSAANNNIRMGKGKWYAEFEVTVSGNYLMNGNVDADYIDNSIDAGFYLGSLTDKTAGAGYYSSGTTGNDTIYYEGTFTSSGVTTSAGDIISVAIDCDNNKVHFAVNGSWTNSSDPATNTNGFAMTDNEQYFALASIGVRDYKANFGGYTTISISSAATDENGYGTFEYAPPSGYYALCTKNLAEFG